MAAAITLITILVLACIGVWSLNQWGGGPRL